MRTGAGAKLPGLVARRRRTTRHALAAMLRLGSMIGRGSLFGRRGRVRRRVLPGPGALRQCMARQRDVADATLSRPTSLV